jgi:hypothetical protein
MFPCVSKTGHGFTAHHTPKLFPGHVDAKLQDLLAQLRHGNLPIASLRAAASTAGPEDGSTRPTIVSTNAEAAAENQRRLEALPGQMHTFKAQNWFETSSPSSSDLMDCQGTLWNKSMAKLVLSF